MNKKLRELLDQINGKKAEVQNLAENNDLEGAKKAKEELQALQNKFDILKDVMDEAAPKEKPLIPATKDHDTVHEFAEAARHLFHGEYSGNKEGTGEDGGYTVPEDIQTRINKYKEAKFSLESLVDVENVSTASGRRTFQKKSDHTGFVAVDEAGKITVKTGPKFEVLAYTIKKYAGYLPVTNELLSDSDANITNALVQWLGDEDIATKNALILATLKKKAATAITGLDDIKKIINVTLGQAYAPTTRIITNDDGLNFFDTLKDTTGRYILSPDAQNPMQMVLAVGARRVPIDVVPNKVLATDETAGVPLFIGDLKEAVKEFDRQRLSLLTSNVAAIGDVNAFEQDLTIFRGIERLDVVTKDADAYVYATIKTAAGE